MKLELCGFVVAATMIAASLTPALADGKAVYDQSCAMCHAAMNPKTGDKAAWAPLIKEGTDALVANAIKGKGAMPAKGGNPALSDADIKAAVEYMEAQSK